MVTSTVKKRREIIGSPPNLPAEQASENVLMGEAGQLRARGGYGGEGDKIHLGGFTTFDHHGISPHVWRDTLEYFGVKNLLDVGCGRGISTSWFYMQGAQVQCIEGSKDAIKRSILPNLVETAEELGIQSNFSSSVMQENIIVEHDFSLGPWWPEKTVDAVWCVELLEHVSRNFAPNYLTAFKKSALIFASHMNWGGWHHTSVR
jgi:2-polyprenyl-3-methyl-5-hydroxy-6-metoxy-1,4-benzoquinol methylase